MASKASTAPQYQIYDIGTLKTGDPDSSGFGVSPAGIAFGKARHGSGLLSSHAFTWTLEGGIVGLPNLAGRDFSYACGANDSGMVVGISQTSANTTTRRPIVWQNGVASALPLPEGYGRGDALSVNASGVAVGSAFNPSLPRAVIYSGGSATIRYTAERPALHLVGGERNAVSMIA